MTTWILVGLAALCWPLWVPAVRDLARALRRGAGAEREGAWRPPEPPQAGERLEDAAPRPSLRARGPLVNSGWDTGHVRTRGRRPTTGQLRAARAAREGPPRFRDAGW